MNRKTHRLPASLTTLGITMLAGCSSGSDTTGDVAGVATTTEKLIAAEDCLAGSINGKVGVCHATGATTNPYSYIRVSTEACIKGHSGHASDFLSDDRTCAVCAPTTCAAQGKNCGSIADGCGGTLDCGACAAPWTCGTDNICTSSGASCIGLPATCGPDGTANCCESIVVPGSTYYRSYDNITYTDSGYPATVSDIRLDVYEVTVGRFRQFVAGYPGNKPAAGSGKNLNNGADSGWDATWNLVMPADQAALIAAVKCNPFQTWTDNIGSDENRPMNCISWYEAFAFCIWDGGRLPTEAEWNYAAAGGSEQRAYPWSVPATSTTISGMYASYYDGTDCVGGDGQPGCSFTDLTRVGNRPAGNGKWGQADLAGGVWEWVLDGYAPYANPCIDCGNATDASSRVSRGGDFTNGVLHLLTAYRDFNAPSYRDGGHGARCARSVP